MLIKAAAHDLYPDPVRVFTAETSEGFNERLIGKMRTSRMPHASKCRLSLLNGERDATIEEMDRIFRAGFDAYVDELFEPNLRDNFDFAQDWSVNVYTDGQAALNHTHCESFIAMTYYPSAVAAAPDRTFSSQLLPLKTGQLALSRPAGTSVWDRYAKNGARYPLLVTPSAGMLVVFPGYMPHWTVPGEPTTRYCLGAFITCSARSAHAMSGER